MIGHEGVKTAVRDHLEATVPARLAAIREALGVGDPCDPVAYRLADSLQVDDIYPLVLIRSTDAPSMKPAAAVAGGVVTVWQVTYAIEIVVACDVGTFGAWADACVHRDRLLLAVRESLLVPANLGDVVLRTATSVSEETGPAAETLAGRPLAVGSLKVGAVATESLAAIPSADLIANTSLSMSPASAGASI